MPTVTALRLQPRHAGPAKHQQRGAASLVVVLLLFFVIALVSAYTSRNLIFEQRTSVNQYRSSMAFEAAEAGLEWAMAMLNAGRIGNDCTEASAAAGDTSFRQRYLSIDENTGLVVARKQTTDPTKKLYALCVWGGAGWTCNCPSDANPAVAAPATPGLHPAFAVHFDPDAAIVDRPGVVRVRVNGCVAMTDNCLLDFSALPQQSEGRSQHSALAVLKPALTTPPIAALTLFGNASGAGTAVLRNTDTASGAVTIQAAGLVDLARFALTTAPGTPVQSSVFANDATLVPNGLTLPSLLGPPTVPLNWDRVFGSTFGLLPGTYREQPATRTLVCPNTGCRAALSTLVAGNPGRIIWIPGDLTLETAGDIGSLPNAADPTVAGAATIVVEGRVRFLTPGVNIFGVVYARDGNWEGTGTITGAALVEGDLAAAASPTVVYDRSVINSTRWSSGSFVMLQGDWRDFIK